jgi:hypothetical protein
MMLKNDNKIIILENADLFSQWNKKLYCIKDYRHGIYDKYFLNNNDPLKFVRWAFHTLPDYL